jgi:hypothetical protein
MRSHSTEILSKLASPGDPRSFIRRDALRRSLSVVNEGAQASQSMKVQCPKPPT